MRRILLSLAMLAIAAPLRAGVYNLDPPHKYPSDFAQAHATEAVKQILMHLAELRAIDDRAVNPQYPAAPDSLRVSYLKQFLELNGKKKSDTLGPIDRINLAACLIRLGRYNEARQSLEESLRVVAADSPSRFLLLLNLASAYQEDDNLLQRAVDTQRQALASWPALWAGWNRWEWAWYRHVEQYALTLLQLRHREFIRNQGRAFTELPPLDALFPGVRFVGSSGEYEAGGIDRVQWAALPRDAEMIAVQLLLWRPHDLRLTWLYAELLNAAGQVEYAHGILQYLVRDLQQRNRELRQHYQVLREAKSVYDALNQDPTLSRAILWALAPRGQLLTPGIGAAANELGGATAFNFAEQPLSNSPPPPATNSLPSGNWLPDWRQVSVGFVTGVLVALLGALQWQQWRRSRRAETPSRGTSELNAPSAGEVAGPSHYSRPVDG
jgi:tetratricopeptide (TPR) repeat protein